MSRGEYIISLSISGRKFDPVLISRHIELDADTYWMEGDSVVTPKGRIINEVRKFSIWRKNFRFQTFADTADTADGVDALDYVLSIVENFNKKSGGVFSDISIDVFFSLRGDEHFGFMARNDLMKKINNAGINFGFEVFPNVRE